MRLRDAYDWLVIGDSPGALLSAGMVARLGLSVLVVEVPGAGEGEVPDYDQQGDLEPNLLLGIGDGKGGAGPLREVLDRIGMLPAEAERLIRGAAPQIVTPYLRIALAGSSEDFVRELEREFGKTRAAELGLAQAVDAGIDAMAGFWSAFVRRLTLVDGKPSASERGEARTLEEAIGRQLKKRGIDSRWAQVDGPGADKGISEFLLGAGRGLLQIDPRLGSTDEVATLVLARTAARYPGGVRGFRALLRRIAERTGAHFPKAGAAEARRIFIESGRLVGVQLALKGNVIAVKGGVLGCAIDHARAIVSSSGRSWPHRLRSGPLPSGWRFTLALKVHREAIPPGAGDRLVWQEEGAPPLEIELAEPGDYGVSNEAQRVIFARTILPFRADSLDPGSMRMVAARMFRQLTEIFPFLEFHVISVYPDFRESRGESVLRRTYPFAAPEKIAERLRCFSGEGLGSRSGVEGLFVASGEAYPEMGSLGQTLAATEATAWIAHKTGLPGPMG